MPTLVCSATPGGVTIYDGPYAGFYPKSQRLKEGRARSFCGDEQFLEFCLHGIKNIPRDRLEKMDLARVAYIKDLNRKALSLIVNLKKDITSRWSREVLAPWQGKYIRSKSNIFAVDELLIHNQDLEEIIMDIHIPRPILIAQLFTLKKSCQVH